MTIVTISDVRRLARDRHVRVVWAVAGIGIAVRMLLGLVDGDGDVVIWEALGRTAVLSGVDQVYAETARKPELGVYPPLYHYMLALVGYVYQALFSRSYELGTKSLGFLMKAAPNAMELAMAGCAYALGRQLRDRKAALWAAGAILLGVGPLATTAYWGMFGDAFYTGFAAFSLLAFNRNAYAASVAWIVLAVHFKPQGVIFVPLVGWLLVRYTTPATWLKAAFAGVGTAAVIWAPFLVRGTTDAVVGTLRQATRLFPMLSANAHNVWFLGTVGATRQLDASWVADSVRWYGLSAREWGLLAFAAAYALALSRTDLDQRSQWRAMAYIALSFFVLNTQMHENYLYPAVVLCAFMCWYSREHMALACLLSVTALANVVLHDHGALNPREWWSERTVTNLAIVNSALNTGTWCVWTSIWLAGAFGRWQHRRPVMQV